ncbi:AbrB/MazE/SpoVT family DNA-binding domain-containing protein [Treponema vincentii]|jgi:putative virulence protein|uniref:SpoVT/AbrB-like protein n=1 Tax=Treponema vincentii ATCC 35580 TaxID=596324 RepID=C8PMK7_9SPIR|nr:AbrB/MazE/SpoVT family DNA-binding domain-containing protein [Treponema vincentii]EEV21424.1 SpoVT/AbrB-like protein [Treponema vincentii ATCC 35580]
MACAKVFMSGNSQAVRIPKEFHIDHSELSIKKIGTTIILYPQNNHWENLKKSLSEFSDDFMSDGRNQPSLPERESLF